MLALFASVTMLGQDASKMFLGGKFGFDNNSVKDGSSTNSFNIGPDFGYMLNSNMAVGLSFTFGNSNTKDGDGDDQRKSNSWNAQPYFRYYMGTNEKFKFFGDLAVSFGGGTTTTYNVLGDPNETKQNTFGINVRPGIQYWFTPRWSMLSTIGRLGYNSTTDDVGGGNETTTNNFGLNVDFTTLNFGMFFHF